MSSEMKLNVFLDQYVENVNYRAQRSRPWHSDTLHGRKEPELVHEVEG